ncbi:MAG TPA: SDR family NAD(P)-dependent oxidoreductase, partial [Chitinophagales bacterium]|nr:SDR family NAD(P)-dependent oxidoreductase [Chitinophagales bacterium]
MENKVAIVSGANGNLGRAVVQYFLAQKWLVIGLEHRLCNSIIEENYQEIEVNLLDENATYNCVNKIITDYGRIDALVHTVGGFAMGNIA